MKFHRPLIGLITTCCLLTLGAASVGSSAAIADDTSAGTSPSPSPTPVPIPIETPTPAPDCRGILDSRTRSQTRSPFMVCSVAVISKKHRVTAAYNPKLVTAKLATNGISKARLQAPAANAFKQLFAAAKKAGYTLTIRSAHRTFASQQASYRRNKVTTAPAGASEHQSGLAADLAVVRKGRVIRGYAFGNSAAGKWVRKHAAEYGLIVRYPNKQNSITGIPYEPWHLRYVGTTVAKGVAATPTNTLERYLKIR